MDKKTIIIVIIIGALVLFYWPILSFLGLVKETEKPPAETQTIQDTTTQVDTGLAATPPPAEVSPEAAPAPTTQEAALQQDTAGVGADTMVVETKQYRVVLSSYGGGPTSILLKNYTYRDGTPVQMLPEPNLSTPAVTFAGGTFNTSRVAFKCSLSPGQYDATERPLEVTYTYAPETGGQIERQFVFYPDKLDFGMTFKVDDPAAFGFERSYKLVWNTPLDPTEPDVKSDYGSMEAAAMMGGSRVTLNDFNDGVMKESREGDVSWAGVRTKYFAAALIPRSRHADGVFADGTKRDLTLPEGTIQQRRITAGISMPFASVNPIADSFTVFVGPLDYMLMAHYDVGLQDMLGIGTTPYVGWLIKPFAIAIMWFMPKVYSVIPNYGIVIILFAFLVKLVTLPLSMRSFKSMQAMKYLQPKIEEMKKRYKKDPQRMNQEMMKMYKEHGVNPMSGCLWVIPQMPLFFALFSVFRSTIMLRDAPFVWFINDLSRGAQSLHDPYIILVIFMVAAQFISGKLTMGTGQQNKMFAYLMPLMMGFIFYRFAAGLVLYWTTFSFLSMLDYILFKRPKNTEVKTV